MDQRPDQPGTPDVPPPPTTATAGAPPPRPPERPSASFLTAGWPTAVGKALLAAVILLVISEAIIFLAYLGSDDSGATGGQLAKVGGYLFLFFHHVGVVMDVSGFDLGAFGVPTGGGGGTSFSVTFAMAFMGGALLAGLLLARAGRAVAEETRGGSVWIRGASGAKVALPYALFCLLLSFLLRTKVAAGTGSLTLHPSYIAAFLWPLAIGLVAGFFGGMRSGREMVRTEAEGTEPAAAPDPWRRRITGALAGGWAMTFVGLVLGIVGFYLYTLFNPEARYYTSMFDEGFLTGLAILALNILALPNIGAWVLFPAMGACLEGQAAGFSVCFLAYNHFPGEMATAPTPPTSPIPEFGAAPAIYFVFLLVPLIAVLWGGMRAADRGEARTRSEGAMVGAMAGVAYALFSLGVLILSLITIRASGDLGALGAAGTGRIGPTPSGGVLMAVLWGVVGGAIGGYIRGGKAGTTTSTEATSTSPPAWTGS